MRNLGILVVAFFILFIGVAPLAILIWAFVMHPEARSGISTADLIFTILKRLGIAIIAISVVLGFFDIDPVPGSLIGAGIAAGSLLARHGSALGLWLWKRMSRRNGRR